MKYRKKPVAIEATQWFKNGDHPLDWPDETEPDPISGETYSRELRIAEDWEGLIVRRYRRPDVDGNKVCAKCLNTMHHHGWIDTFEGGHIVCPGDWIITGVKGEYYPCKPDIFKQTYELVPDIPPGHGTTCV